MINLIKITTPELKAGDIVHFNTGTFRVLEDAVHHGDVSAAGVATAVSSAHAMNAALEIAAKAGRVNFFAGLPKSSPIAALDANQIHYKELVVSGSYSEKKSDFQAAFALLNSGRFPSQKFVTHTLPLDRITDGFRLMETGEALKVCILPQC